MNIEDKATDLTYQLIEDIDNVSANEKKFLGIRIKNKYSIVNVLAIPLIQGHLTIVVFFFTVQIIFLLRDPLYYNISQEDIGTISSDLIFYSMFPQMVAVIAYGYIYDIYGRRKTITFSVLGAWLVLVLVPQGAPNVYPFVYIIRSIFTITTIGSTSHPLINDYVKNDSRGKASALQTFGSIFGDLLNYFVILPLISGLIVGQQFYIVGTLFVVIAIILWFIVKEPHFHSIRGQSSIEQKQKISFESVELTKVYEDESVITKTKKLTKHLIWQCFHKSIIPMCFLGNFIVRINIIMLSNYMTLWTSSFIGTDYIKDSQQAQQIVQNYSTYSTLTNLTLIIPLGYIADKYKYKYLMGFFTVLKISSITCFFQLTNPNSIATTLVYITMVISHGAQNLLTDAVFAKNLPKDIRGSLQGTYQLIGTFGVLSFTKVGAYLYNDFGPSYPFLYVACFDGLFLFALGILVTFTKFNH
ncbi:major facilitator superfamily mfs_1 [Stylonychia lemnae]|uniref:Major facilitator superfamily mfs_1 n=1 Tax=Stylonychia lemnae TaxID=5949 RepID=A0A078AZV4_STYLE|nr:major facilitator superfamily mfs_1 [Stylonychia lemnae]|eukprot:CDW86717.1 major facilitator superfamily mfs_1 [Stylonychia lemnae]